MDCSMPGFLVLHHLPEFAQTHVHWVDDAIQSSSSSVDPFSSCPQSFQHQGLFQWVGSLHQVAKVLELQHQSFRWIFKETWSSVNWFVIKFHLDCSVMCVSANQCSHFYYTRFWLTGWENRESLALWNSHQYSQLFQAMGWFCSWPWQLWSPGLATFKLANGWELMASIWAESFLAWTGTAPSPVFNIVDQSVPATHQRRLPSFRKFHAPGPSSLFECPWKSPKELLSSPARRRNRYKPKETGKLGQEAIKWDTAWKNTDCYNWERK